MSFDDLQTIILNAAICVWALAGLLMVVFFGLFSKKPLRIAPPRRSLLSLPLVGMVALVYIAAAVFAASLAGGLSSLVAAPPAAATAAAVATSTAPATTQAASQPNPEGLLTSQLINVAAQLFALFPFFVAVPALFPERFRGLGLSFKQLKKGLFFGFMAFLTCYGILQIVGFLTEITLEYFRPDRPIDVHPTFIALRQAPPILERIGFYIMAGLLAPFAEELFFRGIFQTTLIQRGWGFLIPQLSPAHLAQLREDVAGDRQRTELGSLQHTQYAPPSDVFDYAGTTPALQPHPSALQRLAAICIVSAVFAGLHQADHFAVLFLLSFALGYIYERTGNLWASITLHALFNSVMLIPTLVNPAAAS